MLERVEIQNFALIESAEFEPGRHFSVISGETGAGKSLLIDALGSLTGKRARKEIVRKGFDYARIEAFFSFDQNSEIPSDITQHVEDRQLILSREIMADGGSKARINGRLVSISLLREISNQLIGLHAQNEQLAIFEPAEQRRLLDKFAGSEMETYLEQWTLLLKQRKQLAVQIREYGLNPAERERQLDLLRYQVAEIEEAALQVEEEADLIQRNKILSSLSRIKKDLFQCREMLSQDFRHSAGSLVAEAINLLNYSARHSTDIMKIQTQLKDVSFELAEISGSLIDTFEHIESEPNEVERINQRLDLISRLKLKYGDSIEDILRFYDQSQKRIDALVKSEKLFSECRLKLQNNDLKMQEAAEKITSTRQKYAARLSEKISCALAELSMSNVEFKISVKPLSKNEKGYYGKFGRDQIEFLIRTNLGEDLLPLSKIASGGEISRILLAIKSIFGISDDLEVLIFDEIDTGVSGETASRVAEMLRSLADQKQVLCVSHMAQVAAASDTHFLIEKMISGNRTQTRISKLNEQERINELARLLSGNLAEQSSRTLAETLLRQYPDRT